MTRSLRPRYGRIGAFAVSVLVTGTAVLGGAGVLPVGGEASYAAAPPPAGPANEARESGPGAIELSATQGRQSTPSTRPGTPPGTPPSAPTTTPQPPAYSAPDVPPTPEELALPADSGVGKRVVFDMSRQRVWLVRGEDRVVRTYAVSGSIYDNLEAGAYQVYSRSATAVGIDDSGTMRYMVRFAHGTNAAIGFHDIPVDDGEPVQTRDQLGTPLSHGCIRQARPDARALWEFAPLGTSVIVTA